MTPLCDQSYFEEIEKGGIEMESKIVDTYEDEAPQPRAPIAVRLGALEDQVEMLREAVEQTREDVRRIKGAIG